PFVAYVDVGRIVDPGDARCRETGAQGRPPRREQRPREPHPSVMERGGRNPGAAQPRPARGAHGYRLGLIVLRMAREDEIGAGGDRRLRQKPVPRGPCRGRNTRRRLFTLPDDGAVADAVRGAEPCHALRLLCRLRAQAVIDRDGEKIGTPGPAVEEGFQQKQKRKRIPAAGDGRDDRWPLVETKPGEETAGV